LIFPLKLMAYVIDRAKFSANHCEAGLVWNYTLERVLLAGQAQSTQADAALAKLCQTYWYPLYVFVRRQGAIRKTRRTWFRRFLLESWRNIISRLQNVRKEIPLLPADGA